MYCRPETNKLLECMEAAMNDEDFKKKVTLEYLNERSHYRATGLKTIRYAHGKFVRRDEDLDGPALDKNNQYRPQKPTVIKHSTVDYYFANLDFASFLMYYLFLPLYTWHQQLFYSPCLACTQGVWRSKLQSFQKKNVCL